MGYKTDYTGNYEFIIKCDQVQRQIFTRANRNDEFKRIPQRLRVDFLTTE